MLLILLLSCYIAEVMINHPLKIPQDSETQIHESIYQYVEEMCPQEKSLFFDPKS